MNFKGKRLVSSESVTEGHPDKVCDQISDAVLDKTGLHITESARREIIKAVALPALDKNLLDKDTRKKLWEALEFAPLQGFK